MTVERLINILVTVTLIEMMIALGLGVTFAELVAVARNWRLLLRAALANYVLVGAAAVGLLWLFDAHPMVAAGFLILAACPGAPYGPPFTAVAKGNVAVAVGLMVLLAGSSALLAPLLLHYLLPLMAADEPLEVDALRIAGVLLMTQLVPLCLGMALRQWRPLLADRLQNPAKLLSKILNLAALGLILTAQFPSLIEIRLRGFAGMLILLAASWAAGWLLGGPSRDIRKALAVTTSLRNVSVGLVIATGAFAGTPAVTAVAAYGLIGLLGTLACARLLGSVDHA